MTTPVKFELAKLLKEKGFSQPKTINQAKELNVSFNWYNEDGVYNANYKLDTTISAPTIAEVVMWLYEKHGIWIWVEYYENDSKFIPQIPKANLPRVLGFYNSPTEAYEDAIEYCLTNLI